MTLSKQTYELTDCDREPIHNIAMIQPFGGFIQLNADWVIAHRSDNCHQLLELEDALPVGVKLDGIFLPSAVAALQKCVASVIGKDAIERAFGLRLTHRDTLFDCAIHNVGEHVVIEFEPHLPDEYVKHVGLIGPALAGLESISDIHELCDHTARMVRDALGYDRVMVYRFHNDDSGEVIAEDKRDDLESYLGLRYPRTDIPKQARDLFRRNKFRIIADIDQDLSPIEPGAALGGSPLDMSMSVLRASSQIHLQYLRNMGVRATLTIAVVRQNRLWGLISCHHYTPRLPAFSLRTVAEIFSQMFSLMLDRMLINRAEQLRAQGRDLHDELMLRLAGDTRLAESLPMLEQLLENVLQHDGASILIGGEYRQRGVAPGREQFMALTPVLGSAPVSTIIASTQFASQVPAASAFSDRIAGALVLPISRSPRDYLVLWRKPLRQTVAWAGNPAKAVMRGTERLQPRNSFAAWEEDVSDRSEEWSEDDLQVADGLRVTLLEVILRMTDQVARERSRAQEKQDLLIAELNHRVRNILNLIRGLVSQSQHDAVDVSSFAAIIGGRITALASAHDNITQENWSPAPLASLFETEIAAYLNGKQERFELTGSKVLVTPESYTVLALVVHELVTNSAKYGSLCDRSGSVSVDISRNAFGDVCIAWRERGGPPVKPPTRRGFGSTIIERSIPFELQGEAKLHFNPTGLEADFLIPAEYIVAMETEDRAMHAEAAENDNSDSAGAVDPARDALPRHILVVEDSMIIALDTEENLKRLGVGSIEIASSVTGALAAIEKQAPDFAIIDFNLGQESSAPVAEEFVRRGVPFVLATGYAELQDRGDQIGAMATLRKPYSSVEIEEVLQAYGRTKALEAITGTSDETLSGGA